MLICGDKLVLNNKICFDVEILVSTSREVEIAKYAPGRPNATLFNFMTTYFEFHHF